MRSKGAQAAPTYSDPQAVYEIQVEGELDQSWEQWLDGLAIGTVPAGGRPLAAANAVEPQRGGARPGRTTLTGTMADQPALRGLLCRLWDLNLTIISVRWVERGEQGG